MKNLPSSLMKLLYLIYNETELDEAILLAAVALIIFLAIEYPCWLFDCLYP